MSQLNLQAISLLVKFALFWPSSCLRSLGYVAVFFLTLKSILFTSDIQSVALYISSSIPLLLGRTLWLKR